MTTVIKATSEADLLRLIPKIAGYTATNSIIVAAFSGKRAGAAFRVNLPARQRLADYRAVSTMIIGLLRRIPNVDGAAVAIYTERTFNDEHGIPLIEFGRHLVTRLMNAGFRIPDAFCVAADGWASYFDNTYPRTGRPLHEIEQEQPLPNIDDWSRLPAVTEGERNDFLREMQTVDHGADLGDTTAIDLVELVTEWVGTLPDNLGALFVRLANVPSMRDVACLQIAFGTMVAESVEQSNEELLEIQRREGGSMDDVVLREVAAGRMSLDDEFASLMMGRGRVRPDVARVEHMIVTIQRLVALVSDDDRPGPLCIVSYLLWARGLASAASVYADMALDIAPSYGMALNLRAMLDSNLLPEWTYG
ncbi:MAG: DUF4192 family protein [Rhodoglobus sp.]